jgi:hypothetical protein
MPRFPFCTPRHLTTQARESTELDAERRVVAGQTVEGIARGRRQVEFWIPRPSFPVNTTPLSAVFGRNAPSNGLVLIARPLSLSARSKILRWRHALDARDMVIDHGSR